jgi:hypothetical protein
MKTDTDTTTQHTPLPWRPFLDGSNWHIDGKARGLAWGRQVAKLASHSEAEANAAFIVTACNSHQALVEALLSAVQDLVASNIVDNVLREEKGQKPLPEYASVAKARAALALAEGGQQ